MIWNDQKPIEKVKNCPFCGSKAEEQQLRGFAKTMFLKHGTIEFETHHREKWRLKK